MSARPRKLHLVAAAALAIFLVSSGLGSAATTSDPEWTPKDVGPSERLITPEDRYAMAGGCYTVSAAGSYMVRTAGGFGIGEEADAEPFHFQATGLGSYLLFGTAEDFVAAEEGALAEGVYAVTDSHPGQIAGGVVLESTDLAAEEIAGSEANAASGRGASVVAAPEASALADWVIDATDGGYSIVLPATGQSLAVEGGALSLIEGPGSVFSFDLAAGCAEFPEIEVNVEGPVLGGEAAYQETRGYVDAHLHMMAFEFLGGRARCGRPWHRFGVEHALIDCPDHEPGGHGAALEMVLSGGDPVNGHNTDGWPSFEGWPRYNSLTHEQVYYKWLERAWRGGLRMFTNLLVDNNQLCKIYPFKRNSCNEMDGVRLQAERLHELQDYIDAQNGGPGEGWFRIVKDPFEAREVINSGKLAVVMGMEVSVPFDCGITRDLPRCNETEMNQRLDDLYDLGVRQMELVNKFDNAFSGVAGDAGATGMVVNQGNLGETGSYWRMETCSEEEEHNHSHDRQQMNFHDESGAPDGFSGRDSLAGAILALSGTSGAAPLYPEGPHCNILGLSELGERVIEAIAGKGMLFDPDHMSARAQTQALDLLDDLGYSGVVSSHGWSNDSIYPRIYELGGFVTPYGGGSSSFATEWEKHTGWKDDRFFFGFGYGADTNGFGSQGGPRNPSDDGVTYPFEGFGGALIDAQTSGTRTYDINTDGVAHYGLYPDWFEDLRLLKGDAIIADMERGTEAYLQTWERAIGVPYNSCRSDVSDLSDEQVAAVTPGMSAEGVLWTLGQPRTRSAEEFTFCVTGARTATVTFDASGAVSGWGIS